MPRFGNDGRILYPATNRSNGRNRDSARVNTINFGWANAAQFAHATSNMKVQEGVGMAS